MIRLLFKNTNKKLEVIYEHLLELADSVPTVGTYYKQSTDIYLVEAVMYEYTEDGTDVSVFVAPVFGVKQFNLSERLREIEYKLDNIGRILSGDTGPAARRIGAPSAEPIIARETPLSTLPTVGTISWKDASAVINGSTYTLSTSSGS